MMQSQYSHYLYIKYCLQEPSKFPVNGLLYNKCAKYEFRFVDNDAASKCDLMKDGFRLLETCRAIVAKYLISSINYFLENTSRPIRSF